MREKVKVEMQKLEKIMKDIYEIKQVSNSLKEYRKMMKLKKYD